MALGTRLVTTVFACHLLFSSFNNFEENAHFRIWRKYREKLAYFKNDNIFLSNVPVAVQ
jgi:hypothetical protein